MVYIIYLSLIIIIYLSVSWIVRKHNRLFDQVCYLENRCDLISQENERLKHNIRTLKTIVEARNFAYCNRISRLEKYNPVVRLEDAKYYLLGKLKGEDSDE